MVDAALDGIPFGMNELFVPCSTPTDSIGRISAFELTMSTGLCRIRVKPRFVLQNRQIVPGAYCRREYADGSHSSGPTKSSKTAVYDKKATGTVVGTDNQSKETTDDEEVNISGVSRRDASKGTVVEQAQGGSDSSSFKGTEPIYPIYTDANPLFDTYSRAEYRRHTRPPKDKKEPLQDFNVETTLINDPPLFMIEPRLRPTPRFPTRKYILDKNRAHSPQSLAGLETAKDREVKYDSENAAGWDLEENALQAEEDDVQYETPLDTALDQEAWNVADLTNDFEQWDRYPTPRIDTSSLPAPAEAQTLPPSFVSTLMRFPLVTKRVVQQGGKGRMASWYVLTVAGNGEGLVGFGEGKDTENARAIEKSFIAACKDLDWVDRFEGRTLWNNIETKWGSTVILMRPRPMGFGLRCNPYIHQVRLPPFLTFVSTRPFTPSLRSAKLQASKTSRPRYGGQEMA